jgi:hypothetical protein
VASFALAALLPGSAAAQEFLKDRRFSEGAGIRAGDIELHPGIAAEGGYDSNWFLRSNKTAPDNVNSEPTVPVEGTGLMRFTPSLTLSTVGVQRTEGGDGFLQPAPLRFRASLDATYRLFFGNSETTDQRNLSANATARADIFPDRPVGGSIFAGYGREVRPTVAAATANGGIFGNPDNSFTRNRVNGGAELALQPGSGTLDVRFGYQFTGLLFEEQVGKSFNNFTHDVTVRNRWKFRPRTALFHNTSVQFLTFPDKAGTNIFLQDQTPLRSTLGLTGLITNGFGLTAAAGYGTTLSNDGSVSFNKQFDSLVAQVEGTFYLTANPATQDPSKVSLSVSTLSLGYTRDFQTSYLSSFYSSDRGYARLAYFIGGRALVSLEGGVAALSYPDVFQVQGTTPTLVKTEFTDVRANSTLFGEYRFTDAFGVNATIEYAQNFSGSRIPQGQPTFFDMNWQRIQAFLGVRYFM